MDALLLLKTTTIKDSLVSLPNTATVKIDSEPKKKKVRCSHESCRKKLKMVECTMKCVCNKSFCAEHRMPENHNCSYDFKKSGKKMLINKLPKVDCEKVIKI